MKNLLYSILLAIVVFMIRCSSYDGASEKFSGIHGDYYGQIPPSDTAKLFAPYTISTGMNERDFAITPDGNEMFFCREAGNFKYTTILHAKRAGDTWSAPEVFEYCTNPDFKYVEPHISPDGLKLFFISTMPLDSGIIGNEDIWLSEKVNGDWTKPKNLGYPVNTGSKEYFPSVTRDGTIYYTHLDTIAKDEFIYRSRFVNGKYQDPEKLGPHVNIGKARYNAFVAADESYIIVPAYGMPDSFGGTDYYISFRDSLDNWSQPVNMGPEINSENGREWSASVTGDGKYLFFMSARMWNGSKIKELSRQSLNDFYNAPMNGNSDIYWISASVIDELRLLAVF